MKESRISAEKKQRNHWRATFCAFDPGLLLGMFATTLPIQTTVNDTHCCKGNRARGAVATLIRRTLKRSKILIFSHRDDELVEGGSEHLNSLRIASDCR